MELLIALFRSASLPPSPLLRHFLECFNTANRQHGCSPDRSHMQEPHDNTNPELLVLQRLDETCKQFQQQVSQFS